MISFYENKCPDSMYFINAYSHYIKKNMSPRGAIWATVIMSAINFELDSVLVLCKS